MAEGVQAEELPLRAPGENLPQADVVVQRSTKPLVPRLPTSVSAISKMLIPPWPQP